MEKYLIVQLFINNYEIMDWDKLKKAIRDTSYIFGGLAILAACVLGINYIALANPIAAIFITLVIFFCLSVVIIYLIP